MLKLFLLFLLFILSYTNPPQSCEIQRLGFDGHSTSIEEVE